MFRKALAQRGVVRAMALLGIMIIIATIGYAIYWWPLYGGYLVPACMKTLDYSHPCDASLPVELDHMLLIDKPYILTVESENRVVRRELESISTLFNSPQCTVTVTLSAPEFEVTPGQVQSIDLVHGESASLAWTLIPRKAGLHTVNISYAPNDGGMFDHGTCNWTVGVVDSAFERMVGLTPEQIQRVGGVLGIGLLSIYFLVSVYELLRRRLALPKRHPSE